MSLIVDEAFYRSLIDVLPDYLWSVDAQGKIECLNARWQEYTGESPEQLISRGWAHRVHPDVPVGVDVVKAPFHRAHSSPPAGTPALFDHGPRPFYIKDRFFLH